MRKDGWEMKRLGDVIQLEYGKPLDRVYRNSDGCFPVYGANGVLTRSNEFYYDKPSIIVGRKGSAGEINLTEDKFWPLDVTYFVTFDEHRYNLKLLYYLLTFVDLPRFAKGVKPGINRNEVYSHLVKLPPLLEQQRIVGILDKAFDSIATAKANAEKNLANARELFDSYLNSVFSRRDDGWVEKTVDELSKNLDSQRIPITKDKRKAGQYPYYGASGIVDYVADYIYEGDTLLISEDGANLLARSTPIAFSVSGKYWVNNHAHILKFDNITTQRFVEYYFASIKLDEYITGAAQPKLNQKALNSIPIFIPKTVAKQQLVLDSLDVLQRETQRLESIYRRKIEALDELKQSILHQAFSGGL